MTVDEFWEILDSVHGESNGDMDRKCALLKNRLGDMEALELKEFVVHFDSADSAAYSWPLWGAAYVINGGCGDDSFSDFRASLISCGRRTFEAAMADPESLAELDSSTNNDLFHEGFQYVMHKVAEERKIEFPDRVPPFPSEPSGAEWDEATVDSLYPGLAVKYSTPPDSDGGDLLPPTKPWWKFW